MERAALADLDEAVRFPGGGGVDLAGRVVIPHSFEQIPGVVLVGGSGPSDRDNDGFFITLREHLVSEGFAVLSYDKRGVGSSRGRWATASVDDLASDAVGALRFLRGQGRVDPQRVSLFGHSEGGWVALRASCGGASPARLVLNSTPAVSFVMSGVHALVGKGASELADRCRTLLVDLADLASAGSGVNAGRDRLRKERGLEWFLEWFLSLGLSELDLTPDRWEQLRAWGNYDPAPDLRRCGVSMTAFFGANDPLVPIEASIEALYSTAAVANRMQTHYVFPRAGHGMTDSGRVVAGYLEHLPQALSISPAG